MLSHRFRIVFIWFITSLSAFAATRTALLIKAWDQLEFSLLSLLKIYTIGFFYDTVVALLFAIPLLLYLTVIPERVYRHRYHRWGLRAVFFVALYGLLFLGVAEWLFWDEFGTRFNFIAVDYLIYRREVAGNIFESYPVYSILIALFFLTAFIMLLTRSLVSRTAHIFSHFKNRLVGGLCIVLVPAFLCLWVNGSFFRKVSANTYANELAGNGIYQFFQAFYANELNYDQFYLKKDAAYISHRLRQELQTKEATFTNTHLFDVSRQITHSGIERHLNVFLVVVESLSAKYMGIFGNSKGLTPYLDSLAEESLLFTNFYATGTRTVRGLEAISLSIPPTPGQSIIKRPDNKNLFSLGFLMKEKGYDTKFLYGGFGYFDNMNHFFSNNGFGVVDRSNLKKEEITFSNIWGVADENLFQRAIFEANQSYQQHHPFFSLIMTTSNHRPYTYPSGRIDIPSGTGREGAVKYTDYAIHQLIETARKQPWFSDTVFVVVADHCAGSAGKVDLPLQQYHIPLFIYAPRIVKPRKVNTLASQIDVAPTLLALLNFDYHSKFFGKNILQISQKEERALISNYQKLALFKDQVLTILSPQNHAEKMLHPFDEQPLLQELKTNTEELDLALAYYQGASFIENHALNHWEN